MTLHKRAGLYAFLPPAVLALSLVAQGVLKANGRNGNDAQRVSTDELREALPKVPYTVRLPTTLANGPLVRTFLDEPDSDQGFQVYTLNTWYQAPSGAQGQAVHLWQSNDNFLARELRDPTRGPGVVENIAGLEWNRVIDDRVRYHSVTTFSRRFDDGVTMTVDAPNPADARAAIEALGPVDAFGRPASGG